jgi:hypothetical protein
VSLRKNPGLFRRVVRHLFTHVLDASKGRIPFMNLAARFNLMPDLNCFDEDGGVDYRRSSIPEDGVVCMDLNQGPLSMYRQPSGHKKELVTTTNIHDRRFRRFRGQNRIIIGVAAWHYLSIMGGGDMDDAVNATDNIDWIEVMSTGDYPVTALAPAEAKALVEEENPYRRGPAYPRQWSMVDYFEAVAAAKERGLSIGPVVNAVMLDVLLSGEHKENMLTSLADRIVDAPTEIEKHTLRQAYDWLRARPDHILREVASNLEGFIDYVKMGKGDPLVLEPMVKKIVDVRDNSMVLPESFLVKNSKGRVRVTAKRLILENFVTAPSLVCDTLGRIHNQVKLLERALVEEQWLNVDSIPETLNIMFPSDRAYREEAIQLRNDWREAFQNSAQEDLSIRYKSVIEEIVRPGFKNWDDEDIRLSLAVEHARLTYRGRKTEARRDSKGQVMGYPDGLLWTNTIGLYYIKAMEEAGLTGLYVPVQFDRWSRNFSRGHFEITITAGLVIKKDDGMVLGTTLTHEDVEDGDYPMVDGMITVREPSEELYMDRNVVNERFDNPVDLELDLDEIFAQG